MPVSWTFNSTKPRSEKDRPRSVIHPLSVNFTELLRTLIRTYLARADSLQHASILFAEADVPLHLLEEGFGQWFSLML